MATKAPNRNDTEQRDGYDRFHIETKTAPPKFNLPNKFDVHADRLKLASMLIHETLHYKFNRDVVLSRPCIYGVFGGRLGGFKPIKQKCVGCMRCVQEYPDIMTVRYSDDYTRLGDASWTPESVFTVYYEAMTGKIPVKGMGYKGSFGGEGWDGMWTDMSEIVRPTRDGVYGREYISTVVDIGRKPSRIDFSNREAPEENLRTVQTPLPVLFDNIPEDAANRRVDDALEGAARKLGVYHASNRPAGTEDAMHVPILNGSNMEPLKTSLEHARIIECDMNSAGLEALRRIRRDYPSALVSARVMLDDNAEDRVSRLVKKDGVDAVHLCADYHGWDWSKKPKHVSEALRNVHRRLVDDRLRDMTTIIVSGGVTLAEHVPKAVICGADMVGLDKTLLVALQSEFKPDVDRKDDFGLKPRADMDVAWGTQRLVNLMASWHDQLIEILSAMGMRDVRRLRGDVGRSMTDAELREQAFQEIEKIT